VTAEFVDVREVRLSIVMAAHNEEDLIADAVERVLAVPLSVPTELIVIDDGSTDATYETLQAMDHAALRVHRHLHKMGRGKALMTGAAHAVGTHLLVFDTDLAYDPRDIPALLKPVIDGHANVVFGNRMFGMNTLHPSFRRALGRRVTTFAANVMFDAYLSDLHTGMKLIRLTDFHQLRLTEAGFGLHSELTAELLRYGVRPYEVTVSYHGRSRSDGGEIKWRDGVKSLSTLARVRLRRAPTRRRQDSRRASRAEHIVDLRD
jgi:glycosyltransferase involved in cell wall biosynthesis